MQRKPMKIKTMLIPLIAIVLTVLILLAFARHAHDELVHQKMAQGAMSPVKEMISPADERIIAKSV